MAGGDAGGGAGGVAGGGAGGVAGGGAGGVAGGGGGGDEGREPRLPKIRRNSASKKLIPVSPLRGGEMLAQPVSGSL